MEFENFSKEINMEKLSEQYEFMKEGRCSAKDGGCWCSRKRNQRN